MSAKTQTRRGKVNIRHSTDPATPRQRESLTKLINKHGVLAYKEMTDKHWQTKPYLALRKDVRRIIKASNEARY